MLGLYENFPKNPHRTVHFNTLISSKRLQDVLIQTFYQLISQSLDIEEVTNPSIPRCTVFFEFGIGEVNNFNFIDRKEKDRVIKAIRKKSFQIMDFLCSIRYYKMCNGNKTPLRFDYYMLRFIFDKNTMDIQVFHERGPMYISPEDVVRFLGNRTNEKFSKRILRASEVY